MKLKLPKKFGKKIIRPIPLSVGLAIVTLGLLLYRLASLVPYGSTENPHTIGFATLEEIRNSILFAPYDALGILILKVSSNDVYTRLVSVAVALVASVLLYWMLRKWYTSRVAGLTAIMFITSSWFLHQGRLTGTEGMYLTVVPALLLICMLLLSKQNDKKLPLAAILLGLILYIPGTWLFVLAGLVAFRKYTVLNIMKLSRKMKAICGVLLLITLAPLIYSFAFAQKQIITWLGFNTDQTFTPVEVANNFIDIPKQLFMIGPDDATQWLSGTPILDIFSVALLILGFYAFYAGYYPAREKLLYGILAICILLIGLGNIATISLLIPLLYIIMANGIAYLLQSWFTVFPRNPVARSIGVGVLCIVVSISCFYHLQRYFVAWPRADATTQALTTD